MVATTILGRLVASLESIVVLLGLGYVGLFIYNPELLVELKVMVFGESFRSKVVKKTVELPAELAVDKTVTLLGKEVPDPLVPLEDLDSDATEKYLKAQQEATDEFVDDKLAGIMQSFYHKYKAAINYEHLENPICFGQTYFFFKRIRPELQQYSLFSTPDLNREASLVFDPNTVRFAHSGSESVDITAGMPYIHATWISEDGHRMAYGYSDSVDSKSLTIRVRDLRQRKDLAVDLLTNCSVDYTSVAWIDSRTGFFYTTQTIVDGPSLDNSDNSSGSSSSSGSGSSGGSGPKAVSNRLMFHRIGTHQEEDFMVFETLTDHDNLVIQPRITSDSHYLLLELFRRKREVSYQAFWRNVVNEHSAVSPVGNKVYYYDLSKFDGSTAESMGSCIKLIDTFSFRFDYISNIEEDFWFRTNYRAPNFRVVRITLPNIDVYNEDEVVHKTFQLLNAWKQCLDWIPQRVDGDYLESANIAAHTVMVLKYLRNASHEVLLYDLTQNLLQESQIPVADLPHPPYGTITGPNCNFYSTEIFYQYSDFAEASSIYRVLIDRHPYTGTIEISFHEVHSTIIPTVNKYAFTTIQETCETKRNVYVPLLISGLREVIEEEPERPKPCIVCVHGGFGMSLTPKLSLPFLLFAQEAQALVVTVNVQGAGLYGVSYSERGRREEKEFAVLDLAYVLRFLVKKKYTTHSQIALFGGTFNGTLIGSAMVQFPSLFASAVVYDGIFDLVKYHVWNPPDYRSTTTATTAGAAAGGEPTTWKARNAQLPSKMDWSATIWQQEFGGCFEADAGTNSDAATEEGAARGGDATVVTAAADATTGEGVAPPSATDASTSTSTSAPSSARKPATKTSTSTSTSTSPVDPLIACQKLVELSPLHQVGKPVAGAIRTCPAVLLMADYPGRTPRHATTTTLASKVSCIHSIKFAAQLQRLFGPKSEHYHENKPILLHLVGLSTNDTDDVATTSSSGTTIAAPSTAPTTTTTTATTTKEDTADDASQRIAAAALSTEEICRIFAFIIHTVQAPWPLPPSAE